MEIEILQRDGEVLQHIMIIIVRIDLHTHAIFRLQLQISRNTLVIPQKHIIAIVHCKSFIAQDGRTMLQTEAQSMWLHLGIQRHIYSQSVLRIINPRTNEGTARIQLPIDHTTENILRIMFIIDHLRMISKLVMIRLEMHFSSIELHAINNERIDMHIAIEPRLARRNHIDIGTRKLITILIEQMNKEVVPPRLQHECGIGQALTQGHLTNDSLLKLALQLAHNALCLRQQPFVMALTI